MKAGVKYETKSSFAEGLVSILIFIAVLYIIGSIGNKKKVIQQVTATAGIQAVTVLSQQPEVDRPITAVRRKIQPEQATQIKYNRNKQHKENNTGTSSSKKTIHTIHTMMVMMIYTWMTIMIMTGIIKTAIMLMA